MKVIFCLYDGEGIINGINAWLLRLLPALVKNHIEVAVICMAWASEADCTLIPVLRRQGVSCTVIPLPHYTEAQIKWILRHLNTEKPDIFIPGNMLPALYAARWAYQSGIATIAILHNDDAEYHAILEEFIFKTNEIFISAVVAVSHRLHQRTISGKKNMPTYRIPYGASVPDARSHFSKPFKVVYIGRIVQVQKNIGDIAASFCQCAISLPGTEFHIYGSGPDSGLVEKILTDFQSPYNVFFNGHIANEKIRDVLLDSHCMVLLSDYEGIPVALMEAMACGVVPICRPAESGIPELLIDHQTGFFIEKPEDLIYPLTRLLNQPELWEVMSVNCQKKISEDFSERQNLSDWLNLFQAVFPAKTKTIRAPRAIRLPPAHPSLVSNDQRDPGLTKKAISKLLRLLRTLTHSHEI